MPGQDWRTSLDHSMTESPQKIVAFEIVSEFDPFVIVFKNLHMGSRFYA